MKPDNRIAFFLATSGHSGVDKAARHLLPELAARGYSVDLLKVRKHGPHLEEKVEGLSIIDLGSSHVYSSLPPLISYLRRERPAVLFTDKDRVNRTALAARYLARVPTRLILSYGSTPSINLSKRGAFERWLQRNSIGRLYPMADSVIVPSEGAADDMSRYTGLSRKLIQVVPRPVLPDGLLTQRPERPDHPWFREQGIPLILGVGELSERKDFATLVRGFATVRQRRNCRLMILGKGKERNNLLRLAAELGVEKDVKLPGFVTDPYAFMFHADLFAMTSRWEGLGFVLIEALAMGTPSIAADCPSGPAEILDNGRYGPLIKVGDSDTLSRKIELLLDDPPDAERLREAARPYTVSVATDAYLDAMGLGQPR